MGDEDYWCTRDRARIIAMEIFQDYERKIVEPRHKETQDALHRIEKLQWIAYGGFLVIIFLIKVVFK